MVAHARHVAGVLLFGALLLCGPGPSAAGASLRLQAEDLGVSSDTLTARAVAFTLRYDAHPRSAGGEDRWLGRDKAKHVAFSALWTLSTQYVLVSKAGWTENEALPAAVGSAAAIGVAKEVYDARQPHRTASHKDLVANVAGIGLAVGLIVL